jgi:hypothetical protein
MNAEDARKWVKDNPSPRGCWSKKEIPLILLWPRAWILWMRTLCKIWENK